MMRFLNGFEAARNFELSMSTGVACTPDEDLTIQSDRDECDINAIVARYNATGLAPRNMKVPFFADLSEDFDFQTAHSRFLAMDAAFNELPSSVRLRFNNSAAELHAFVQNPVNRREAAELGLFNPEVSKAILAPEPPKVVPPAGDPPAS